MKEQEYITLEEALKATGLAEKTLKNHMRGNVPVIGKNAWCRQKFFEYWDNLFNEKQQEARAKTAIVDDVLEKIF